MGQNPPPGPGCWQTIYPNTKWVQMPCSQPDYSIVPTVGDGTDKFANSGSTNTAWAQGSFSSVSGITTESDSGNPCGNSNGTGHCSDYYSLQINTNSFQCTVVHSVTCWQQFVFLGVPTAGTIEVVYYLPGYYTSYTSCPSGFSQGPSGWTGDCISITSAAILHANNPTTRLGALTMLGSSNYGGDGYDLAQLCDGSECYAATTSGTTLGTYNHWTTTEFNVLGYGGGSTAQFNSGTSLTAEIFEYDHSGNQISPSCATSIGSIVTAETNNLSLGTCTAVSPPLPHISFSESS